MAARFLCRLFEGRRHGLGSACGRGSGKFSYKRLATASRGVPGLHGFSVHYSPGKTVEELAQAGRFPHALISCVTARALTAAVQPLGYSMRLITSPGQGYDHTFTVVYDASGAMLRTLPHDAAHALRQTFQRRANPYRMPWP